MASPEAKIIPAAVIRLVLLALLLIPGAVAQEANVSNVIIKRLERAANQGDANAQAELGNYYYVRSLSGDMDNFDLAVKWYKKAAKQDEPSALFGLGACYERGLGVPQDMELALEFYERAANHGLPKAQITTALTVQQLRGNQEAAKYFKMAADQGSVDSQRTYGQMLVEGDGVPTNIKQGLHYLNAAADNGDLEAKLLLVDYYSGSQPGIEPDLKKVIDRLWEAAAADSPIAITRIAYCYENGIGFPKDTAAAVKWYQRAAKMEYAPAMVSLGHSYALGRGASQDFSEAYSWYRRAAAAGSPIGHYYAAYSSLRGEGTTRNDEAAVAGFREAARGDVPAAQYQLGRMYQDGRGVAADPVQAALWFRKAVRSGHTDAMVALARCHLEGSGVPADLNAARDLLKLAVASGNKEAIDLLESLDQP